MESSLEGVIKASWNSNTGTILEKLERLQDKLKEWVASIRKTREGRKRKLTKELEMLETKERDDDTIAKIIETRVNMNMEIDKDEMYWEQRVRANWLKVGDKNSTFFHKFASTRRKQNIISRLQLEDGGESSDDSQMAEAATSYFQELFMSNGTGDLSHIMQGIETSISQEMNANLLSEFTEDEVLAALKGMGPKKAPGPDGFPALFFQRFWHIVGNDVTKFCLGFLNDNQELRQINSTDIILIPKTQSPTSLANFRPISLCSVLYKIVAKVIANRLRGVIGGCVDEIQSAFVPRRVISDNILLAVEILHNFRQKCTGKKGYMAVKLDMSKAYDRVEWRFIEEVMLRMGFENRWVEKILKCITTASFVININGNRSRVFQATRGLRQRDSLSPFLFLTCSEGLLALMRLARKEGLIKGAKASRRGPEISHLLFTDDCILFGEATDKGARLLKRILKEYEECSGQCVNFNKSTVFYSSNTSEESKKQVLATLGVRSSADMEKYLGLPNTVGRRKKESFQNLKDNIQAKIKGWSSRFLSQGGKEVFIKSVLQAIPTYAMSCFLFPNSLCGELEGTMAKFWWQKAHGKRGIHWCQWKYLCLPKDEGGLGFRSLAKFNVALLAKQGWRILMMPNSLVAKFLKAKYFPNTDFLNSRLGNNCSFTWKNIWAAKGVLSDGLCWKVGCGSDISVLNDSWIPDFNKARLLSCVNILHDFRVAELIDENSKKWKEELIHSTFSPGGANKILHIPLAEEAHDDIVAWSGTPSGEFTVRSAYKLLQCNEVDLRTYPLQTDYKKFYKKLWDLNLPSKIKIVIWRISWNYIPTRVNMQLRKLSNIRTCPRCGKEAETSSHVFRECPVTKTI
ncbi:reverse transcriptase [Gossypium australe]|uniref:Reverse transcriptase n=1 Tax=Gossypium australe TaxID=47621 RepID=A0A5B6X940_9ROSI|nr:reverse transcriptase [Gossypium australe]